MIDPLIFKTIHNGYTIEMYGRQSFNEVLVTYAISNKIHTKTTSNYKKFNIDLFVNEEIASKTLYDYALKVYETFVEEFEKKQKITNVQETLDILSKKWSK